MMDNQNVNIDQATANLLAIAQAINNLTKQLQVLFPQGTALTTSAGGASGKFLTIVGTDGNTYKVALQNP